MNTKNFLLMVLFSISICGNLLAQDAAGSISIINSADPISLTTAIDLNSLPVANDKFNSSNSKGPFFLSWKPVIKDTEKIIINSILMVKDLDYEIDYLSGFIIFRLPVLTGKSINISYKYDPATSTNNTNAIIAPLTLNLIRKENVGLKFIGSYKGDIKSLTSGSGTTTMGLVGNKKSRNSDITSMILLNATNDANANTDSSLMNRTAMKLGATTEMKKLKVTSSYQKAGTDFATANDYQLQQGKEIVDVAAAFEASKYLALNSTYRKTSELAEALKGISETAVTHSIAYNKEGAPRLTAARTEVDRTNPGSSTQKTITDNVKIEHNLNANTSAAASHDNVVSETDGMITKSSTDQLSLTSRLSDRLGANALLMRTDSTGAGETNTIGLNIDNQASKNLSMKAGILRVSNEMTGEDNSETINLTASPSKIMNVILDMSHRKSDVSGEELSNSIKINSAIRPDTTFELSMASRDVQTIADEMTKIAKLSTTALKNTRVQLDWQDRDTDATGNEDIGKLTVEATPGQKIKIAGVVEKKDTDASHNLNREAHVNLNPSNSIAIGGGYIEKETNGNVVSRIKEASATVKPLKSVEISGLYKTRDIDNQDVLDTMNVALSLNAGKNLQFTGSYANNPEDKNGIIQMIKSQSFGLNSDFGRLKLKSAFTLNDEYLFGKNSNKAELGFDMRFAANSILNTGLIINRSLDGSLQTSSEYSLGFTHNSGDRLSLYFGGKLTTYEKDRAFIEGLTEYQAEAKVGIKF